MQILVWGLEDVAEVEDGTKGMEKADKGGHELPYKSSDKVKDHEAKCEAQKK